MLTPRTSSSTLTTPLPLQSPMQISGEAVGVSSAGRVGVALGSAGIIVGVFDAAATAVTLGVGVGGDCVAVGDGADIVAEGVVPWLGVRDCVAVAVGTGGSVTVGGGTVTLAVGVALRVTLAALVAEPVTVAVAVGDRVGDSLGEGVRVVVAVAVRDAVALREFVAVGVALTVGECVRVVVALGLGDALAVRVADRVAVTVAVPLGVRVSVIVAVEVVLRVTVCVAVRLAVAEAVGVRVEERVAVTLAVADGTCVAVRVAVDDDVLVAVTVWVADGVGVNGGVGVEVKVGVRDGVALDVAVAVRVAVADGVTVRVAVRLGVRVLVRVGVPLVVGLALAVGVAPAPPSTQPTKPDMAAGGAPAASSTSAAHVTNGEVLTTRAMPWATPLSEITVVSKNAAVPVVPNATVVPGATASTAPFPSWTSFCRTPLGARISTPTSIASGASDVQNTSVSMAPRLTAPGNTAEWVATRPLENCGNASDPGTAPAAGRTPGLKATSDTGGARASSTMTAVHDTFAELATTRAEPCRPSAMGMTADSR